MIGLEELTVEELCGWIRENVPDINERDVVLQTLYTRHRMAWDKYHEASKRSLDVEHQIRELVTPYLDGPLKPGVKLRRWPKEAAQAYERLDQLRKEARTECEFWFDKQKESWKKITDIYAEKIAELDAKLEEIKHY